MSYTGNALGNFGQQGIINSQNRLWTPDFLSSNMLFWWDTSREDSLTLSGGALTQLRDLSGKGVTLNQSGAPGWSSANKVATFNGSQSLISSEAVAFLFNGDFTLVTLLNPSASQSGINSPLDIEHSGSPVGPLVLQNEPNRPSVNNYYFAWNDGAGANFFQNTSNFVPMAANAWSLSVMTKTGAVANAYTNGSQVPSFPATQASAGLVSNPKTVAIGRTVSSGRYWVGSFGGAIVFNRSLRLSEIQKLEGYILWLRNLQSILPASHPFRNRPPLIGD